VAKWLKVAGLAVVALLVAASASGDSNTYNYQTQGGVNFNAKSGQVVDASGNAKVVDADRDRDNWGYFSLINTQFGATSSATMADSNATPVDTHGYSRLALVFYPQFDSLSTVVRYAVQVRAHYSSSSDSAATFPWYRWPVRNNTVMADIDSIGQYTYGSRVVAQSTSANLPTGSVGAWSGEFIVTFNVARNDSIEGGSGGKWGAYPRGMYLPLNDYNGAPYWAPYTTVRVRVLSGIRSRARLRVDLVAAGK